MELLYEELMDHYKNPRNYGSLKNCNIKFTDTNPLCGDEILITVNVDKNIIKDIKFNGVGCAISKSAASVLTEYVKGKNINDIMKMSNDDFIKIYGFKPNAMRTKCALLAFLALKKSIIKYLGEKNAGN